MTNLQHLHARVLEAERILSGAQPGAQALPVTNATVAECFDQGCASLREELLDVTLAPSEQCCLAHFLQVTDTWRPNLIRCYDLAHQPRTNNDMEGFIHAIKTRYRRISGRKNWNRYLLRYGRRVAFDEARVRLIDGARPLDLAVR
ncbi:MAG: hypothetical protein M5U01_17315 [Ardenticatenaceae bacterium]|nr:hypothetical protein [Ardenticatenaceae bacterium]